MRRTLTIKAAVLMTVGLLAFGGWNGPTAVAQNAPRKDFQIALEILSVVTDYDQYDIFDDVTVNVKDGVTSLYGKVTMPYKRDEIEKRVKKVRGVSSVRNQIEVLPPSKFDEELRVRIANTIYNNQNFWAYATLDKKPIHIIAEGNKVTLSGIVHSDLDRKLAQSLAMQAGAGQVINNLKTDVEARQSMER